jgi:phosphoglycolate phosphatase-like HAD superfamily hydrolase
MIKYVGFDKDGTLIDDVEGYAKEWGKLINLNFNIDPKEAEELFMDAIEGPTVRQLSIILRKHDINLSEAEMFRKAEELAYCLGEDFKGNAFPEVLDVFKQLKEEGYSLFVSSGQQEIITKEDLERTGLMQCVDYFLGIRPDQPEFKKGEPHFRDVAEHFDVDFEIFIKETVFVGDTLVDVENPKKLGMKSVARAGTLSKERLLELGADFVIPDLSSLPEILKNL